jgi:glycosyltransferase involved in cell wall biosynthesis
MGTSDGIEGRIRSLAQREPAAGEVCIQHMMPPGFRREADALANVGYTVFETDRLPRTWVPACNAMDEIWVPSDFCIRHFTRSGVREAKLHVIPHGVDTDAFNPQAAPVYIDGLTGFVFLSVFYWSRRKGWDALLRAYVAEFRSHDEVSLVIRAAGLDFREMKAFLDEECRAVTRPPILVLPFAVPAELMPGLYTAADAFVTPARGEGWGMPYSEAMASGLPTIATRWGGHLQFMNDSNSILINYEQMAPIDSWMQRATGAEPDHLWAEPSVDDLRRAMRWVFEHREEGRALGEAAREHISAHFTWRHAALRICERLEELGEFTSGGGAGSARGPA